MTRNSIVGFCFAVLAAQSPAFAQETAEAVKDQATAAETAETAVEQATDAVNQGPEQTTSAVTDAGESAVDAEAAPSDPEEPSAQETSDTTAQPEAPKEPEVGQIYIKEQKGDWYLECMKTEDSNDPCQMFQPLFDIGENRVANAIIERVPAGSKVAAGMMLAVPLKTLLSVPVAISVDGAKPKLYNYTVCDSKSCYARIGLSSADVNTFKRGNNAKITIIAFEAQDKPVEITMSLTGFTSAFDEINK